MLCGDLAIARVAFTTVACNAAARRTAEFLDALGMRGAGPSGMHAPFAKP